MESEDFWKKRFEELAMKSYRNNEYTFTGFLGPAQIALFYHMQHSLSYAGFSLFGGNKDCERQILRFGSEAALGYAESFPIACVEAAPTAAKFADTLQHRDFLGALINLGLERVTLGDIIVYENSGYVFCLSTVAPFITDNLDKVKHTSVKCRILEEPPAETSRETRQVIVQAAAERVDALVARVYHLSRGASIDLFRQKRVFINGRQCENNSYLLKPDEVVSVRGFGKFTYKGWESVSKKGKKNIIIEVLV